MFEMFNHIVVNATVHYCQRKSDATNATLHLDRKPSFNTHLPRSCIEAGASWPPESDVSAARLHSAQYEMNGGNITRQLGKVDCPTGSLLQSSML